MKKNVFFSLLVCASVALHASGYSKLTKLSAPRGGASSSKNVIKLKPVGFAFSTAILQYERSVLPHLSIGSDFSYTFFKYNITDFSGVNNETFTGTAQLNGFGISPEIRYYTRGEGPKGFYLCGFGEYYIAGVTAEAKGVVSGNKASATASGFTIIGGGVSLGWQWLIGDAFCIDLYLGGKMWNAQTPTTVDYTYSTGQNGTETLGGFSYSGFVPTAGLSLGLAF